jgi:hypothetical protein
MGNRNSKKSTKCCTIVNIDTKEVFNLTKNELKSQYIYYPISNKIANKIFGCNFTIYYCNNTKSIYFNNNFVTSNIYDKVYNKIYKNEYIDFSEKLNNKIKLRCDKVTLIPKYIVIIS